MGVKIEGKSSGKASVESSVLAHQAGKIAEKLPGGNQLAHSVEMLVAWGRANSLWPLLYGTSCCAIEMMSTGASRHDWARFGTEVARASARQADLIILAGTVVEKMSENLYRQCHRDLERFARNRGMFVRFSNMSSSDLEPFSYIDFEARKNELHLHTFHAFPEQVTIIKTQSLIGF